jgi:hypothetical protein
VFDALSDCTSGVSHLAGTTMLPVDLGAAVVAGAFSLNRAEHDRRQGFGAGAVTSLALLHGLWMLPEDCPVEPGALPDVKVRRLRDTPCAVEEKDGFLVRSYRPAGVLRAVAFAGGSVERTIEHAIQFSPIVSRFVMLGPAQSLTTRQEWLAREWSVGVFQRTALSEGSFVVPPSSPVLGVPSVFRWWIAELAYESLLQTSAQPVS